MSMIYLVTAVSLAATEALVANGYGFGPSATIVAATNATPIVLTTGATLAREEGSYLHGVFSGVGGNTAANGTHVARVLANTPTTTTLALYTNTSAGLVPVAGSGVYTSGGVMATAFTDGRILFGPEHIEATRSPPSVLFVPMGSAFDMKPAPSAGFPPNGSTRTALSTPWTWTDTKRFAVEVWGSQYAAGLLASDATADYAYTEALRDATIQAMSLLFLGAMRMSGGVWAESQTQNAKLDIVGRRFTFNVDVFVPVLLSPAPIPFVPGGTGGTLTVHPSIVAPTSPDAINITIP